MMISMAIPMTNILFPFSKSHHCPNYQPLSSLHNSSLKLQLIQPCLAISPTRKHASSSISMAYNSNSGVVTQSADTELAKKWREIHGSRGWADLLDPIDPILRSELVRYGEMTQACYDAFVYDPYSKYCGTSRFGAESFFRSLGMENRGYEVTCFLYATGNIQMPKFFIKPRWSQLWSKRANWIGYVAVSDDETSKRLGRRDIVVAWRGTVTKLEWVSNLSNYLNSISRSKIQCPDPEVKVEYGFLDLYTDKDEECGFCKYSAREQILSEIKRLKEKFVDEEVSITITGHSLGSALAMISAYDIAETGLNNMPDGRVLPISVFSYAGPRVGNIRFKERLDKLGVKVLRVVNVHDVVPKSPGLFFNENLPLWLLNMIEWLPWTYSHVGVELKLDHLDSPYLRRSKDPASSHNLEALMHLLDGYHGKGKEFKLALGRDPALVNKASDFLEDKYAVPPMWRQDENKGMIFEDGRWIFADRSNIDGQPQDTHHHLNQLGLLQDNNN